LRRTALTRGAAVARRHDQACRRDLDAESVDDGHTWIAFLLSRGPQGVESFDADLNSLGTFQTQHAAAGTIAERFDQANKHNLSSYHDSKRAGANPAEPHKENRDGS
jgi:hypothetical protein